jgi:hypothetical protein
MPEVSNSPELGGRVVTLEGYINHAMDVTNHHWRLELMGNGQIVTCNIWHDNPGYVPYGEDALVRATGVYLYKADPSGLLNSIDLWVSDAD